MRDQSAFNVVRLLDAVGHAWAGFRAAFRSEPAFRLELALLAVLAPLGAWLGRTGAERALLIGSWLGVLVVELLNSGIETVVDRIGPERHPLSKRAKDLGAAAVMTAVLAAGVVWGVILVGLLRSG
jgi:diacylglycerol kinase (ATP)